MCFVHKHMQNADFGQILCRRASTKRHVTSRPMVRFSQTWYQKMRKTWKKKLMKRRVAICGGREAVADFVQGGQVNALQKHFKKDHAHMHLWTRLYSIWVNFNSTNVI